MAESTRYFQLTQDILVEYNYITSNILINQAGDVSDKLVDLKNLSISTIDNQYDGTRYFYIKDSADSGIYADESKLVVPINKSKTKFIKYSTNNYTYQDKQNLIVKDDWELPNAMGDMDIVYDKIRLHFTSRNFMGDYDGLIIQGSIYRKDKSKIGLLSFLISRLDNICINENPMLINQKLYTSYIDLKIPSTEALLKSSDVAHGFLKSILSDELDLLKNTPIVFDIFGIKNTHDAKNFYSKFNYRYICEYNCEKINSISVPSKDSYDEISVDIKEANDGDYFVIRTLISSNESLSDYIYNYTDHPEAFIILHELSLREYYVDIYNMVKNRVTHREHYMINAAIDVDGDIQINESALDDEYLYRPICKYGSKCVRFVIEDTLKIINTLDNTTIVKKSSLEYDNPVKYGKHMNKIYISEMPMNVNVYNKRNYIDNENGINDEDIDMVKITNGGSNNVNIENHQHSLVAFIESANVGVDIEQVVLSDIENIGDVSE